MNRHACRGGAREGLAGAPAPARIFFSSPSLNDIYNFSLSSKVIKILAPLNFFFYFRHCMHVYLHIVINRLKPDTNAI